MRSLIFTQAELEALKRRENGDKTDKTGIYYGRTKPKIEEILYVWFPKKKKLQKLTKKFRHYKKK